MISLDVIIEKLPKDLQQLAIELDAEGALTTGAHYRWPRESGGYLDVIGGGLLMHQGVPKFVGCHNSKIVNGAKITLLDVDLPIRMIAQGEVQYMGNFLNPEYRKKIDMEKFSLAIMGLVSTIYTIKENRRVSVDDILNKVESGEMSLVDLMKKAGLNSEDPLEEMSALDVPPSLIL
jgi:hypothetical protein